MKRRVFCASVLAFAASAPAPVTATPRNHTILVLGDSLSAEFGLQRGKGWVALMERKIADERIHATVINASISGDTTYGGRTRLPALLAKHQPQVLIIELGANDALRGMSQALTQENLIVMAQAAQKIGAKVVLLGMQLPPNYGPEYTKKFAETYPEAARITKSALVPFFLEDVANPPDIADAGKLFQSDNFHPNELAQPILLRNVWPIVRKTLP